MRKIKIMVVLCFLLLSNVVNADRKPLTEHQPYQDKHDKFQAAVQVHQLEVDKANRLRCQRQALDANYDSTYYQIKSCYQ